MIYFANKWLTGRLFKELSYEGKHCIAEMIDDVMAKLTAAKARLQGQQEPLNVAPAWPPWDQKQ